MRRTAIILRFLALAALLCWGSVGRLSAAQLERVLMPGDVAKVHEKTEGNCSACHKTFDKAAQPALCMTCHKDVAADIRGHRGFHGRLADTSCRSCHTDHKGRNSSIVNLEVKTFRHTQTDFELLGAHKSVACSGCHLPAKKFREAPQACIGCHKDDDFHRGTLGTACADCHQAVSWKTSTFDHAKTGFVLRGKHAAARCDSCHKQAPALVKLGHDCVSCHRPDDVHKGAMGAECGSCHTESAWKPAKFDHGKTRFPLLGAHADTECRGCHARPNVFSGASMECVACHKSDDVHAGTLGSNCKSCHVPQAWKPSRGFDHSGTRFPLIGKHRDAACLSCHKAPTQFRGIVGTCVGCHAKDDPHAGKNGAECASCHVASSWKTTSFDHATQTKFPLLGAHGKVKCQACHTGDLHKDKLDMRCLSCHAKQDVHRGKLGQDCARCHATERWASATFDHGASSFPLLGQHRIVACKGCHADQSFKGAPTRCVACHIKNDAHSGKLGSDCASCHNSRDWRLWDFDHAKRTQFPLLGAHATLKCELCHVSSREDHVALPSTCGSCHGGDDVHNGAFGMRCERCHTTTSFKDVKPAN